MSRKRKQTPSAPPTDNVVSEARRESAALLNLDPNDLSPAGALRCDMVSALRAVLDDELAKPASGSGADLNRLIVAVEHLVGFLKEANPARADDGIPALYKRDSRQVLEEMAERWIAADAADRAERGLSPRIHDEEAQQHRIDDLEAELVRLRGPQPHALPSPEAERTITPRDGDIVPPLEQSDRQLRIGADRGPERKQPVTIDADGRPLRPGSQIIDGKVVPIPPQAKPGHVTEAQRIAVNNDRATVHRVMTQPSRVKGEPQPSSTPIVGDPIIWPVRGSW